MNQKLKNYSSGMQVRLAFSVAIKARGDVLVLDEVLAVGDESFQRKCNDYFLERKKSGKTTILVTHDMGAAKKYCNKAILIENGLIKVSGDVNDVANQYSLDNLQTEVTARSDLEIDVKEEWIENLEVNFINQQKITPNDEVKFEVSYDVKKDTETYIAFSLTDVDRNIWIYNDNSLDYLTKGKGHNRAIYTCKLDQVNNLKLKLQVSIRNKRDEMIAFADEKVILINRNDISDDDKSAQDSATGLIQRNGSWEFE